MKRAIFIAATLCFASIANAGEPKKEVEVLNEYPTRPYSVISPISASKKDQGKAFQDLKKQAAKLGADAILNWQCAGGTQFTEGLLKLQTSGVAAQCQAIAIKWTSIAVGVPDK